MTGADIIDIRTRLGLSQRELAERMNRIDSALGVQPSSISRWECGRVKPGPHAVRVLELIAGGPNASVIADYRAVIANCDRVLAGEDHGMSLGLAREMKRLAETTLRNAYGVSPEGYH